MGLVACWPAETPETFQLAATLTFKWPHSRHLYRQPRQTDRRRAAEDLKTTAFDLQLNPVNPGMSFHKLGNARDKNFWAVRVNSVIVHTS